MRVRHMLIGVIALVLILIGGAAVYLATTDWGQRIEEWARSSLDREVRIGAAAVDWGWPIAVTARDVVVGDAAETGGRPLATIPRLEATLSVDALLDGVLTYSTLRLSEPTFHLPPRQTSAEADGSGTEARGTGSGGSDSDGLFQTEFIPDRRQDLQWLRAFSIEDATVIYDPPTGDDRTLTINTFTARATGPDVPIELTLTGRYDDMPLVAEAALGTVDELAAATEPFPVQAQITNGATRARFKGVTGAPFRLQGFTGDAVLSGKSLAHFGDLLGVSVPYDWPYEARGRFAYGGKGWSFTDADGRLNGRPFVGAIRWVADGNGAVARRVAIDLHLEEAAAAALWPASAELSGSTGAGASEAASGQGGGDAGGFVPAVPVPAPATASTAVELDLEIDRLHLAGRSLGPVRVEGRLTPDGLTLDPLRAEALGGEVIARVRMAPQGNGARAGLQFAAAGLDPALVLPGSRSGESEATGTAVARIALVGHGAMLDALVATLDGRVLLGLEDVTLGGRLARNVASALGQSGTQADHGERIPVRCFVVALEVTDGVAAVEALLLRTPQLVLVGDGRILLGPEEVRLTVRPAAGSTVDLPPVRITGPVSDPTVERLDPGRLNLPSSTTGPAVPNAVAERLADPLAWLQGLGATGASGVDCAQQDADTATR